MVNWRSSVLDYPTEPRATEAIETLIYSIGELLRRLPAAADSEMKRLRDQAANALDAAKAAIAAEAVRAAQPAHPLARGYFSASVVKSPRMALGGAVVLGLAIGFWSGRITRGRR